jgi:hypothetical protein
MYILIWIYRFVPYSCTQTYLMTYHDHINSYYEEHFRYYDIHICLMYDLIYYIGQQAALSALNDVSESCV